MRGYNSKPVNKGDDREGKSNMEYYFPEPSQKGTRKRISEEPTFRSALSVKHESSYFGDKNEEVNRASKEFIEADFFDYYFDPDSVMSLCADPTQSIVDDEYLKPNTVNKKFCSSPWYLDEIETIPSYYPLEQTSKIIPLDGSYSVTSVTQNITKSLKVMSVQPKYVNNEASVALLSLEHIEMYLCLWKTEDGKSIIIEMQRRRGCPIIFHDYCHYILDAASGGDKFVEEKNDNNNFVDIDFVSLKRIECIMLDNNGDDGGKVDEKTTALNAIKMAQNLLDVDWNYNSMLMGMKSLCILTDPRKTTSNVAIQTSKAVLFGETSLDYLEATANHSTGSKNKPFKKLHEHLLKIVLDRNNYENDVIETTKVDNMHLEFGDDDVFFNDDTDSIMLNLALTILANSLEVLLNYFTSNSDLKSFLMESFATLATEREYKSTNIMKTLLMNNIGNAKDKPHNSFLACKSLRHLLRIGNSNTQDPRILEMMSDYYDEILLHETIINEAYKVGLDIHSKLEKETEMFLKEINILRRVMYEQSNEGQAM